MKSLRLFLFALLALFPAWLLAADSVKKGAVTATLLSPQQSIQPGKAFWVGLKLQHEPHWHTYWINPGTGYPTSIEWTLPEGFKAGPIVWPTPHLVKDTRGNVTGHGYEGETILFVEITPPSTLAAGGNITLQAAIDWLMCAEVCVPGGGKVDLSLPVSADAPKPNDTVAPAFNQAFAALPQPLKGWETSASRDATTLTLRLKPAAGNGAKLEELHVFDSAGLVDYVAPQTVTEENGVTVVKLAVSKESEGTAAKLEGILYAKNGWGSGTGKGATFDAKLEGAQQSALSGQPSSANPASANANSAGTSPSALSAPPVASSLGATLALALVGGLILNLMPCVFPVLGIKVLGFVNQSGNDRSKIVAHGLTFSLGVLLSFWTLAGVLLLLRSGGSQLGWGFQLQSPGFVFGMAAFLLVFALNLSGLFEFGLSATGVGGKLQMQSGYAGSFFTGVLATLVATPCSAPFLAPALGAALTLSPLQSILVFTAIAVGLALPYLLLSIFPSAVKLLPKPGAWMETFKQLMAFPLYATVGWLLWVLAGQTKDSDYALLFIVFGFVLVAMATWVYGRFHRGLSRIVALLLVLGGVWIGYPKDLSAAPAADGKYAVKWEHWSPEAVAAAQAAGRTVYVDFTARWCATCQTNKAAVFSSTQVLNALEKKNVLLLKADWTSRDPAITAELAKWNRSAVPFNLIYAPKQKDPIILPELLTPGIVLENLAKAGE